MIDTYERLKEVDEMYERIKEFARVNRGAAEIELLATFSIPRHEAAYYVRRLIADKIIENQQKESIA